MALGTDLATAKTLAATLASDGANPKVVSDANQLVADLGAQVSALTADLATAKALQGALTTDDGNPAVMTDIGNVVADLTANLS